jgi:undecaprenyl-diphosphatase
MLNLLLKLDSSIGVWLFSLRNAPAIKIFTGITFFGEISTIIILALIACAVLWRLNKKYEIIGLLIAVLGSSVFTYLAKILFDRPRPLNAAILETSGSFPSGHATIAVAFYGFLAYLLLREIKNKLYRVLIVFVTLIVILTIGFSRLYLGVHYFSDVFGGYLAGLVWFWIGVFVNKKYNNVLAGIKESNVLK